MENKPRKQLSSDSLAKLAIAREKALQTRLKNKAIREQLLEPDKETIHEDEDEKEPEQIPIPDKVEPKKIQPDTDEDEEVAKPKKLKKKKPNRSKIIISNDSSSSDSEDDAPVVYIRTKKKNKQKPKPVVVEQQEIIQDLQPQYQEPPEIIRQVPLPMPVYEPTVTQKPDWW